MITNKMKDKTVDSKFETIKDLQEILSKIADEHGENCRVGIRVFESEDYEKPGIRVEALEIEGIWFIGKDGRAYPKPSSLMDTAIVCFG